MWICKYKLYNEETQKYLNNYFIQNSWVTKFQRRLINLRRPPPGMAKLPAAKRQKSNTTGRNLPLPTKLDDVTYNRHIRSMKVINIRDTRSRNTVSELMIMTIPNRMDWIKTTKPSTKRVLEEFPHLKDFDIVSKIIQILLSVQLHFITSYVVGSPVKTNWTNKRGSTRHTRYLMGTLE